MEDIFVDIFDIFVLAAVFIRSLWSKLMCMSLTESARPSFFNHMVLTC